MQVFRNIALFRARSISLLGEFGRLTRMAKVEHYTSVVSGAVKGGTYGFLSCVKMQRRGGTPVEIPLESDVFLYVSDILNRPTERFVIKEGMRFSFALVPNNRNPGKFRAKKARLLDSSARRHPSDEDCD
jgi:hypothetical protein